MIGRYKGQKKKWGREERRRGKERTRQTSHVLPPQALRPAHPRAEAQRERQRGFERARTAAFFPEERDVDAGTAREGRGGGVRKARRFPAREDRPPSLPPPSPSPSRYFLSYSSRPFFPRFSLLCSPSTLPYQQSVFFPSSTPLPLPFLFPFFQCPFPFPFPLSLPITLLSFPTPAPFP